MVELPFRHSCNSGLQASRRRLYLNIQPDARESCEAKYKESACSGYLSSDWILHDPTECFKHSQK
jgi:hypothetical protein